MFKNAFNVNIYKIIIMHINHDKTMLRKNIVMKKVIYDEIFLREMKTFLCQI